MVNKINPNPKPRFPKGKTHKDMRIVRPIDLDPIVDAINQNEANIEQLVAEAYVPAYKSYVAKLSQTGTDDPLVTVLYNDLGFTPIWSRIVAGRYETGEDFIAENTQVIFNYSFYDDFGDIGYASLSNSTGEVAVSIYTCVNTSLTPTDDLMGDGTSIEIRVYE